MTPLVAVPFKKVKRLEFWDCEPLNPQLCALFENSASIKHFVCKNTFIAYVENGRPSNAICPLLDGILANKESGLESLVWCPLETNLSAEFVNSLTAIKNRLEFVKIEEIGRSKASLLEYSPGQREALSPYLREDYKNTCTFEFSK